MSSSAIKLDYARIRNAQKKNNRSTHELTDTTNIQNNEIAHNSDNNQPDMPAPNDNAEKQGDNKDNDGTPRQDKSDFLNVFGNHFYSGNLDYVQSLIMSNNKSNAMASGRDLSGRKGKGHKRAKSSLAESSQKPKSKQGNEENIEPSRPLLIAPNISSSPVMSKEGKDLDLKLDEKEISDDVVEDQQNYKNNKTQRNPHNTPYMKEGKLFDQFFKRGGLERRSMSLEDLRFDKKEVKVDDSNTERAMEQVSNNECLEKSSMSKGDFKKDFIGSLNGYIQYFDNSENAYKKNKKTTLKKYFLDHEHKGNSLMKKDLEATKEELKSLRKNNESIQKKMLELVKINKFLVRELEGSKLREEGYQEKAREIEEKFEQMKQRKSHYKEKVEQMQELLEMERIDNENNLVILKQVLANNMNHAGSYSNKRDKPSNDYSKAMLKEYMQQQQPQKNKRDFLMGNPLREKKLSNNGGVLYNNRYDVHLNKKSKGNREDKMYEHFDLSMVSHKGDMDSSETENFTSENNFQSNSSMPYMDTSYQREVFNEIYVSQVNEKKLSKEEQIKLIQSKIMNLMEEQEPHPYLFERSSSQKSLGKHKHKASESVQNYAANRERESTYMKSNYGHIQRSELKLKKMKSNNENRHPDELIGSYLTNKSD